MQARWVGHWRELAATVVARKGAVSRGCIVAGDSMATHSHEAQPWLSNMGMLTAPGLHLHARSVGHCGRAVGPAVARVVAGWTVAGCSVGTHAQKGQPCASVSVMLMAPGLQRHAAYTGHGARVVTGADVDRVGAAVVARAWVVGCWLEAWAVAAQ